MVFIYETNVMFPFLCRLKLIWLIHLPLLWLLQLLLLLQLKHQLLNKKRKRRRNLMKIWALVCLTKHVNFSIGNMSIIACPIKPNTFASSYLYILCVLCAYWLSHHHNPSTHTFFFHNSPHTYTHSHTMGLLLTKLWQLWHQDEQYKIIIIGLDNAGKTTLLYRL
jgi:hypothetical protein